MTINYRKTIKNSSLLLALLASNFLNFLFNSLLGRWLSFEEFGLITLVITFYYVSGLVTTALAASINFQTSTLLANGQGKQAHDFFLRTARRSVFIAVGLTTVWLLLSPLLTQFFHVPSIWPFVAFAPIIVFSTLAYAAIGYFQGKLEFTSAATVMVSEPIAKLLAGCSLVALGLGALAYAALPISLIIAAITGVIVFYMAHREALKAKPVKAPFPKTFFVTTLITGLSTVLFFSVDIFLVKHFFTPEVAGRYALLSLIGKMVFFFTTLPNIYTLPLVARSKSRQESNKIFVILFSSTAFLAVISWLALGEFGSVLVPLLFGEKTLAIIELLKIYTLGIGIYALCNVTIAFHLARKEYFYSLPPLLIGLMFAALIILRHGSLEQIVSNVVLSGITLGGLLLLIKLIKLKPRLNYA